jgi:hypothetical protein
LLSFLAGCDRAAPSFEAAEEKQAAAPDAPLATAAPKANGYGAEERGDMAPSDPSEGEAASPRPAAPSPPAPSPEASAGAARAGRAREHGGAGSFMQPGPGPVRAGEWDDNANYREFMSYLDTQSALSFHRIDLRHRRFVVVRDMEGRGVPNCRVTVSDGSKEVSLTTAASGRAILFPHAEGLAGNSFKARTACAGGEAEKDVSLAAADAAVDLQLDVQRPGMQSIDVDVAFILDTTGSMSEEINAVTATIDKVATDLAGRNVRVRVALVEYKDRGDAFVTKVYPFTADLQAFGASIKSIRASGGGDMPEDAVAGLHAGLTELSWSDNAVARLAFMIGDAAPHLDYQSGTDYESDLRSAARRGIKINTVAASGMDALGQAVWRQVAQYTGGTNLFVLRGGAGPQSVGGGDPKSSCGGVQENFSSGNLDELILAKVQREIDALERNPMRIAGLGEDENAKPCDQRVTYRQ